MFSHRLRGTIQNCEGLEGTVGRGVTWNLRLGLLANHLTAPNLYPFLTCEIRVVEHNRIQDTMQQSSERTKPKLVQNYPQPQLLILEKSSITQLVM